MLKKICLLPFFIIICLFHSWSNEGVLLDKIHAIISDKIILQSDIENQMEIMELRGENEQQNRCDLMYQMVFNKILTIQAENDSLPVSEEDVEVELDRKINYFVSMAGSIEAFESHYNKSIEQIKDDFRDDIREQLFAQQMRGKIVGDIKVTPSEVKTFFEQIPKEELPYFDAMVELQQVVIKPKLSDAQKEAALTKIKDIKKRLTGGESFELLASLYSEDAVSAQDGGNLGWATRGSFVKEFEAVGFKLQPNEISDVVETQFGYHILQLIERRGDQINLRHILIRPKTSTLNLEKALQQIDSIRTKVINGKLTFFDAIKNYSEDEQSKNMGGSIIDYETGSTTIEVKKLPADLYQVIENLKIDELSTPNLFQEQDGTNAYRIVKLLSKSEPHVANLQQDYDKIQQAAINEKEQGIMEKWLNKHISKTYLLLDPSYNQCELLKKWIK